MSIVPLRWGVMYVPGLRFTAYVAIFRKDGTVCITHGGVEIGQGIDTKVFIIVTYSLLMMMRRRTTRFVVCKYSPSSYVIMHTRRYSRSGCSFHYKIFQKSRCQFIRRQYMMPLEDPVRICCFQITKIAVVLVP